MIRLLFISGWGFDRSIWDTVRALLPPEIESDFIDFGFMNEKQNLQMPQDLSNTLIIAHSLGGLYAMRHIQETHLHPKSFVYFNGFTNFNLCVPNVVLDKMIEQFAKRPEIVLKQFYKNCGLTTSVSIFSSLKLHEGLKWLREWENVDFFKLTCPLKIVLSYDDKIVPIKASRKMWGTCPWHGEIQTGGHALPLSNPQYCAVKIKEALYE